MPAQQHKILISQFTRFSQPTEETEELVAIRSVFDIYVRAKLMEHNMPQYAERLRIPDKKYFYT